MVFFSRKIEIYEIQNFNKIPSFTISFLFFYRFWLFFSISPIQTCKKIMTFFVVNDGILLKFWISNISIFFENKNL